MRLAFDVQSLIQSRRYGVTGIARWTLGAISHLRRAAPGWDIEGYALVGNKNGAPPVPHRLESGRSVVSLWKGPLCLVPADENFRVEWAHPPPAVLLGTSFLTPLLSGAAEVPVVHDLAFLKFPETQPENTLDLLKAHLPAVLDRARLIVTVSNAMKEEIVDQFSADPQRVAVVTGGCDQDFMMAGGPGEIPDRLPQEFFLVVGTLEPRKNLTAILTAHRRLRRRNPAAPVLLLAGGMGWQEQQFVDLLNSQIASGDAVWPGFVSQSLLKALYRRAVALVFPSLYEGFGLPIIEAMAQGCPVITSNASGTAEAAADAAVLVDPRDEQDIEHALERVLQDEELRQDLRTRGRARAGEFTWERTGRQLKEAILKATGG